MAKSKDQKKELIEKYKKLLEGSPNVVVIKPSQLTPNEVNDFRRKLFEVDANFNVVKNTLFKIALQESNLPEIEELKSGEHAVMFTSEDYVAANKMLKEFAKEINTKDVMKIELVKGILDGELLEKETVEQLAEIPPIEGSISMILGIMDQAIAGVTNVLQDSVRSYVSVIDQAFKEDTK